MQVKIYSTATCPYCVKAKNWFKSFGVDYTEVILDNQDAIAEFREACPGKTTVPQIFVGDRFVGGHDDLMKVQDEVRALLGV